MERSMKSLSRNGRVLLVLSLTCFRPVASGSTGFSCLVCLYLRCTGRTVHNPRQVSCQTQLIDTRSHLHQAFQPGATILIFLSENREARKSPTRSSSDPHPIEEK